MGGGKVEVFIVREFLVIRSHEGFESDSLVGLNILNKALWENRSPRDNWASVGER